MINLACSSPVDLHAAGGYGGFIDLAGVDVLREEIDNVECKCIGDNSDHERQSFFQCFTVGQRQIRGHTKRIKNYERVAPRNCHHRRTGLMLVLILPK